ncbi:MAG: carbonate dehydratase [Alphaproteobacteria bacterium]
MENLKKLFEGNRQWAQTQRENDPDFFSRLAQTQNPEYFWISCSDSRVATNRLLNVPPGTVFVHRNVANVVSHSDLNCLSAMQFAVDILKVRHIILCGHYQCGGVRAVQRDARLGFIDNWLRHVHDVKCRHETTLQCLPEPDVWDALCELNVVEQLRNATETSIVRAAWEKGQELWVHGVIYDLRDGILHDLQVSAKDMAGFDAQYAKSVAAISKRTNKTPS